MEMSVIKKDAPGANELLMGNEAIARGALEAGVKFAAAYPGNPSSEIIGTLAQVAEDLGIYVEWSVNEKVAPRSRRGRLFFRSARSERHEAERRQRRLATFSST
ncbi:MAG: hypothetical protein MZU97_06430 [Bacillus subtilis]|nr:hypothetical protein [Bacillus subtilis]